MFSSKESLCLGEPQQSRPFVPAALGLFVATFSLMLPAQAHGQAANAVQIARAHKQTGVVTVPASSKEQAGDKGLRMHSNVRYLAPASASPYEEPPYAGYLYETPASLACIYHLVPSVSGCDPNKTTKDSNLGSQSIAIVDAFDDPNASADLQAFSSQFGLPYSASKFKVVYADGAVPPTDPTGGWELEESLDIEYAHAMAPNAKLYLVEAKSNSTSDLFSAILVANNLIQCGKSTTCPSGSQGRGEISLSWGGSEFSGESAYDSFFSAHGVVYFAASGDVAGTSFPCVLSTVVCAGGTTTSRSLSTGKLIAEIAWSDAGSGVSEFEPIPPYQQNVPSIANQLGGYRGVPDLSADSNPNTGVWVLDTYPIDNQTGWFTVGGTSAATPILAGVTNASGTFPSSGTSYLTGLYAHHAASHFHDVTYGSCGPYSAYYSGPGWDLCTGLGSPANWGEF